MRSPRQGVRSSFGVWLTRPLLAVGVGAVLLGGCSCEGPQPRPRLPPPVPVPFVSTREMPQVRVRLGEEAPSVQVAVEGPYRVSSGRAEVATGQSLPWTEMTAGGGGVSLAGRVEALYEFRAERDGTIWVHQEISGKPRERCYRGAVRVVAGGGGWLRVINILPMEHYLAGVLANEMPKAWHLEAFKAQAVAARTYALDERNQKTRADFDVYDSVASQVYGGAGTETRTVWDALTATWGIVATYRGDRGRPFLVKTYFHSTCGGGTVPAGTVFGGQTPAPLMGAPCLYCRNSPRYQWPDVVLTKQDVGDLLKRSGAADLARVGPVQSVKVTATTGEGGRAELIRITGTGGAVLVRAGYFRGLVGYTKMFSTWCRIEDRGNSIAITDGHGSGHGVGLCQWGAEYLAENGLAGEQILRFYYPRVELVRAY